jgi:hypothetical protein
MVCEDSVRLTDSSADTRRTGYGNSLPRGSRTDQVEQEEEISHLRQTNEANKRRAQFTMDIGVLVALVM